jgi:LacI family transcriptional regulator
LTAIDQPIAATFSKAVELLIHQATSPSELPYLVAGSLVERESTAPPKS